MSDSLPVPGSKKPSDFTINRYHIDLTTRSVRYEKAACTDLEDVLGGAARAYKLLGDKPVQDAYDPDALLIMNLGILSGSRFMTGLRTFFHGYSPLKASNKDGAPSAMWSTGSGKFGTKLRWMGLEEVIFTGKASGPVYLRITESASGNGDGPVQFEFLDATDLKGKTLNGKIQDLHKRYSDAHFAVIGPAAENYENCRYACIGLSTENQLASGDAKTRFAGRGGLGGVMGSKNLLAIVADKKDPPHPVAPASFKDMNLEIARGKGSARFRDKSKGGGGGTWANYDALNPVHAMPEYNFAPTGTAISAQLHRDAVELGPHIVKDEACFSCGIRCHKNVYEQNDDGSAGKYLAKLDFEPLNLLSSNIGIFDIDQACDLVELVDEMGMDSISCSVTISYVMAYNHRNKDKPIAGGLSFGDYEGTREAVIAIAEGRLPELGQGTKRLGESLGETQYAMHCKGMEFAAYLPQTNPGYPFALAGSHMSMRTYLLLLYERETGMDYWVDAITERGPLIMRDDMLGVCKFANLDNDAMATAISDSTGLKITGDELTKTTMRTYLRGWVNERTQGYDASDYDMPEWVHWQYPNIQLPYFNTPEFFAELKGKVISRFNEMAAAEGIG